MGLTLRTEHLMSIRCEHETAHEMARVALSHVHDSTVTMSDLSRIEYGIGDSQVTTVSRCVSSVTYM